MSYEPDIQALIHAAIQATEHAYIPYSHYPVGAALRAADGTVYTGCNIENAAYPATICGERTALVKAVSEGQRQFDVIAIATKNAGTPCGMCRQMLFEFAPDLRVITVTLAGEVAHDLPLRELLLHGFGPGDLPRPE